MDSVVTISVSLSFSILFGSRATFITKATFPFHSERKLNDEHWEQILSRVEQIEWIR